MAIVAIFHLDESHWSVLVCLCRPYVGQCISISLRSVPLVCSVVSTWIVRWPLQQFFNQMSPIGQSWCVYVDRTMASVPVIHLHVSHWSILVCLLGLYDGHCSNITLRCSPIFQSWFICLDRTMAIVAIFHLEVSHWSVLVVSTWIVRWPLQQFFTQNVVPLVSPGCVYLDRTMAIVAIFHLEVSHWSVLFCLLGLYDGHCSNISLAIHQSHFSVLVCLLGSYDGHCSNFSLRCVPLVSPGVSMQIVRWPVYQYFTQKCPIGLSCCIYLDRTMAIVAIFHLDESHWSVLVCLCRPYVGQCISISLRSVPLVCPVVSTWIVRWPLQQFFNQMSPIGQSWCVYVGSYDGQCTSNSLTCVPLVNPGCVCLDCTMAIVAIFHFHTLVPFFSPGLAAWIVRWPLQQFFTQKCPIGQSCCIYLDRTMAIVAIFHL